jgi:hypothetical protein
MANDTSFENLSGTVMKAPVASNLKFAFVTTGDTRHQLVFRM